MHGGCHRLSRACRLGFAPSPVTFFVTRLAAMLGGDGLPGPA